MPVPTTCARCGANFGCGAADAACWCAALPALQRHDLPLQPLPAPATATPGDVAATGCLCPACLAAALAPVQRPG